MVLELSLMGGAFAVMASLYILHYLESSRGVLTPAHKVGDVTDPILEDLQARGNELISHFNRHTLSLFMHSLFVFVGRFFVRLSDKTYEVSSNMVEKASQRKEDLSKAGAPSFYVKQIKEAKDGAAGEATDEAPRPRDGATDKAVE